MAGDSFSVAGIVIPISIIRTGDKAALPKIRQELRSLTGDVKQLNKEQQKNAKVAQSAEQAQKTYTDSINKGTWGTKSATTVSRKYYDAQRKGMVTLKETTQTNLSLVDTMNQLRWTMVNVTFAITAVAGLAYPFYAAAKAAGEFEIQLKKIQAVTGGMPDITGGLILEARAGRPFERGEVAESFLQFSKAGFTATETADALSGILDLAQAGMMELGTAASLTAQIMRQFSKETLTASDIADILVKAADTSRASVDGLGLALSYVGPFAEQLGVSIRQTVATLQILTDRGLNAQKAGTSLRQAFAAMIDPSVKAKKALGEMGVNLFDVEGNFKGVDKVIREFSVALKGLPLEEQARLMGSIFEVRAMAAVNVLMSAFNDAQISVAAYTEALNDSGVAHDKALIMGEASLKDLSASWNDLKDSLIDIGTAILKWVAPIMTGWFNDIVNVVNAIKEFKNAGRETTTEIITQSKAIQQLSKEYEELEGNVLNMQAELDVITEKAAKFSSTMREVVGNFITKEDFYEVSTGLLEVVESFENFSNVSEKTTAKFNKLGLTIGNTIVEIIASEAAIESLTMSKIVLQDSIKIINHELSLERKELKALNSEYQNVKKSIRELNTARFTGETKTLNILAKANTWLKKEKLATLGVGDAQAYINEQLSRGNDEYDDLFERLSRINSAMDDNTDAFKAWEDSIKTAIRAEVEAGEELVRDVTDRIRTWQTALLGIQSASQGDKGETGLNDFINKLQLAYDVHFGGMRQEVGNFMKEQEDLQRGTYEGSADVIALLNEEYAKLPGILSAIATTEGDIDVLTAQLLTKEQELYDTVVLIEKEKAVIQDFLTSIDPLVTAFDALAVAAQAAADALIAEEERQVQGADVIRGIESGAAVFEARQAGTLGEPAVFDPHKHDKMIIDWLLGQSGISNLFNTYAETFDDALIRPGQRPIKFHPQDTIIATKGGDGGGMGGTSNITVNMNATGELNYDAYQLAREIKLELAR